MHIYDSVIIGGGPAGLTAAIYLARFMRDVLVVDYQQGRSMTHEINENYFGFPNGIKIKKLCQSGKKQAEKYGAKFVFDKILKISKSKDLFSLNSEKDKFVAKTVIYATGVTDLWPKFDNFRDYIGRSLFWCITCDGHKTIGKKIVIVGDTDDACCTAMQFLDYTDKISIVTNQIKDKHQLSNKWLNRLNKASIKIYEGKITKVIGDSGYFQTVEIDNRRKIKLDQMFNQQGSTPNSVLAQEIGVKVNNEGYIKTDYEKRTNIPFFYAAGDVTSLHAHQIVLAAAEGATAGVTANYDLYQKEQKCI